MVLKFAICGMMLFSQIINTNLIQIRALIWDHLIQSPIDTPNFLTMKNKFKTLLFDFMNYHLQIFSLVM